MKNLFSVLSLLALSVTIAPSISRADANASDTQMVQAALQAYAGKLHTIMVEPNQYTGHLGRNASAPGTFCEKESTYFIKWQARISDAIVNLDPKSLVADIVLKLDRNFLDAAGYRKGGLTCLWMGGEGRLDLGAIEVHLKLLAKQGKKLSVRYPAFELDALRFDQLKITQVNMEVPFLNPFGNQVSGDAPDWLNQLIQDNLNGVISVALQTSLKTRLNDYVTDRLGDFLEKLKRDGQENPNSALPVAP